MVEHAAAGVPASALPFDRELADEVHRLVARLDVTQRAWLSGYLAGTLDALPVPSPTATVTARPVATILYGSQSGNCELLAQRLSEAMTAAGLASTTLDMLDCRKTHLDEAHHLLVIVSTHGEGDPPDRARPLYDLLHGRKAPKLAHLKYSVLALGDSSYERFCETGRRFDAQLEALGAQRLHTRVECDVDFEDQAQSWIAAVVQQLVSAHTDVSAPIAIAPRASASVATAYTRKNPWMAPVLANIRLTGRDSTKDVRHVELSIEDAGIHYEPGDALGVVPRNRDADVVALLGRLPFPAEAAVTVNGVSMPLISAVTDHLDIGLLSRSVVERYASATQHDELLSLCATKWRENLDRFLLGRHLIDLVLAFPPTRLDIIQFVELLRPLAPRLYSIASSPRATPDEVHLTVRTVSYESHGRPRLGVVSGALADATGENARVRVYPHRNQAFRLPANPDVPIVMIGPGTGVAPFRAFLAEREVLGARGKNWLFFGDRTLRNDFLYQTEWLDWRKRGLLNRLDVAFSRDGNDKVYVQHRIAERGSELYAWLQEGARLYVCGDAQQMAPDVEVALREVIRRHGGLSSERADEFLVDLQRSRRYQKDVY